MPSLRSPRQALAHLHQMAGLDVQGPQLIAPVLQALHSLVAFDTGAYVHPGCDGALQTYVEDPGIHARQTDYFDPHILRSERQVFHCSLRDLGHSVHLETGPLLLEQLLKVPHAQMLRSDFYNVVLRPSHVTDWATLVLHAGGERVGTLILYRQGSSPPFTRHELDVLAPLLPALAHVLQPGHLDAGDSDVLGCGLLIVTDQARPQWISPEAEALLQQAFGWRWRGMAGTLPEPLQELVRRLNAPALLADALPVPQLHLNNAQGWFSLHATRMADVTHAPRSRRAVALHITRRVARGARLLSALRALDLPQRQQELAWWLARGLSESQIAQRMGISINTAVYHRRQVYNRLGVTDRPQLLRMLERSAPHPAGFLHPD